MAYFRTIKNERRLILTAQDKAKQEARAISKQGLMFWRYRIDKWQTTPSAIDNAIGFYLRYFNYRTEIAAARQRALETVTTIRKRLHATMKVRHTGIWTKDCAASGDPNEVRAILNDALAEVRYLETIARELRITL